MTAEREIAGFAFPLAAGTAAAVYAGISAGDTIAHLLIFGGTVLPLILLLSDARRSWPSTAVRLLLAVMAAGVGALCGLRSNETSISGQYGHAMIEAAGEYGDRIEETADLIPFEDTRTNTFVKAVLTGERNGMPQDVIDAFRDSGASHILALSGLHLGVIYMMISRLLSFFGYSLRARRVRAAATVLICGLYTLATGAGPSIMRAFLFIVINEAASLTGRYRSTGNTLMAALMIHLCIDPGSIRSVGFQLSYAAMAGIAFIYPVLKSMWPEGKSSIAGLAVTGPARWIWNSAAMSIACQLTTGPIAFIYFGTFPLYFLLTNLIALPLTGIIIPASAMTLLLYKAGICPDLLIRATEWLIGLLIGALETISAM